MDDEIIVEARRELHRNPETAGEESGTADFIADYISNHLKDFEIRRGIGGHGLVATKRYGEGPHIAFRAELDALPVLEKNAIPYQSKTEGKSHACGHDGHMSIVLKAAELIEQSQNPAGTLSILFQPAEETGQGSVAMLEDLDFKDFAPKVMYALHNIPGRTMGLVYSRSGTFACGSVGVRLHLIGKTAHAAHPEDAINPILLSQTILNEVTALATRAKSFALVTPIALRAGEKTFGTTPLKSTVLLTMRAELSEDLNYLMKQTEKLVENLQKSSGAEISLSFEEFFPVTRNRRFLSEVREACQELDRPFEEMDVPFRWSEDFGHFADRCPIHMFGLGSGADTAPLHASNYDFPDELILQGAQVFAKLFEIHQR